MKIAVTLLVLAGACFAGTAAVAATTDDVQWINRCVSDNQNEKGATPAIILKYCTCMNNKMSDNETQSISTWEKSHPAEMKACDREAGWR